LKNENINEIIEESLSSMLPLINEKGIKIVKSFSDNSTLYIDKDKLKQALINIIKNGIEAIDENGVIEIKTIFENNHFSILIKDNGKGIESNEIKRVFDIYYSNKKNGTGLGLSIANKIIIDHGGKIELYSEINVGTEFKIII